MSEQQYMLKALDLAARAEGRTCPNPPVGAVLVKDGCIVGQGYHPEAGQPHAEVYALQDAGETAAGADLYVTLEPCNHHGKTGPCTEAVIAAGVKKVFVGTLDPNPLVAGKGVERLESAGIEVVTGVEEAACKRLIAPFAKHVTSGLPYVILKMAMTLDGQTATSSGDSKWISNEESRLHVHKMRDTSDAIMVGVGTVLADNPQLTTRLPEAGVDPVRIVVDSTLKIPIDSRIVTQTSSSKTLVITTDRSGREKIEELRSIGVDVIIAPSKGGQVDLNAMMSELGKRNIQSVLLEGGATLAAAALQAGVVDRAAIFIAPKMLGGNDGKMLFSGPGCKLMSDALQLQDIQVKRFSDDVLIEGELV